MTSHWIRLPALAGLLVAGLSACGTTTGGETPEAGAAGAPTRADALAPGGDPTPDLGPATPDAATPGPDARIERADAALVPFDAAASGGDGAPGPNADAGDDADAAAPCTPDRHAWDLEMHGLVDTYCGQCHGEPVAFGAPYPLTDYDALMQPIGRVRPLEAIASALTFDRMPPAGQPHPTDEETARLVAWATCGDPPDRPAGPAGLEVSAEPLPAPAAPPNLPFFDLRADEFPLAEDASNPYICFAFDAPADAQGLMRRIEPLLDDQRVVHHLVLMHDREGGGRPGGYECAGIFEEWIYAWGPGEGPLQFPEGGLRLSPGDRFIVQIHYNNGGHFPNVRDSSGVRIYYGPDEGPEYGLTALGPANFDLPARERSQATGYCTFHEPVDVLSSWPHMHELGYALESTILRADAVPGADEERLISLRGWHFESQWIYSTPTRLEAGDAVRTTCTFDNIRDRDVGFGPGTEDEMCFNFVYTTPPLNNPFCDGPPPPQAGADAFVPGECAPPGVMPGALPWVDGALLEGAGADPVGDGREPLGMWVLESGELWIGTFQTPFGVIDGENSRYSARGYAMFVGDGNGYVDLQTSIHAVVVGGQALDVPLGGSFSGPLHAGDAATPGTVDVACGQFGERLTYAIDAQGRLVVGTRFDPGIPVTIVARFVRP
jgi:hypothetical protein